jgi:hypothetical protein
MFPILPLPPPPPSPRCLIAKLPLISVCLSACGGDAQLGEYKAILNQREEKKDRGTSQHQFYDLNKVPRVGVVFRLQSRALSKKISNSITKNPFCLIPRLLTPVNFCLNLKLYIYLRGFYKYVILATAKTKQIQDPLKRTT